MAARSATRFLAQCAGAAGYLGLAIWGYGGFAPFFAEPAFVALTVVMAVLLVLAFFAGGNLSAGVREDRGNRWVLAAFGILGLIAGYLPAYTDRIGFWTIDGEATRWIGMALFTIGGVLRLWPVFVLGSRFSGLVAIQPDHKLETHGIYALVRNPSYLGMIVLMLGWGLAFRGWSGVVIALLLLVPLASRIRAEERLLHEHFGAEYEAYVKRTWRLVPLIY